MVMVCMCVLTDGDGVCMCVLTDGGMVGQGVGSNEFVVAYHIKFTGHILPNKVVAKLDS